MKEHKLIITPKEKEVFTREEQLLMDAVQLIQYFVKRVEEGTIKSKTTYKMYKDFLNNYNEYLQG